MTGKIYHPEDKHPEPYQQDLAPDASKGLNWGQAGPPIATSTAYGVKDLHNLLSDFTDDELKQIPVIKTGTRLETAATYLKLAEDCRQEYQAHGDEDVGSNEFFIPKEDTPYEFWNRLIGHDDPRRAKRAPK